MQIIVALNLLLALSATQLQSHTNTDAGSNGVCVLLSMVMSVLFAQILIFLTQNRFGDSASISLEHKRPQLLSPDGLQLAVWTVFSLTVTFVFQWSFIANALTGQIAMLPQLVTLLPHLLCLLIMWIISDCQTTTADNLLAKLRNVFARQNARVQMLLVPVLLPIFAVYGVRSALDSCSSWQHLPTSTQTILLSFSAMVVLLLTYPLLLSRLWKTTPLIEIHPKEGRQLQSLSNDLRLRISSVEHWNTQLRIANAAVVGWIPGVRKILLSDVLVRILTPEELKAVFLHEAGHIRKSHTLWRLTTVLLPLMLLLIGIARCESAISVNTWQHQPLLIAISLLIFAISAGLLSWFAKQLELEADRYAWQQQPEISSSNSESNPLISAMLKTARVTEASIYQTSLLHPTTAARIRQISQLNEDSNQFTELDRRLTLIKRCLLTFFFASLAGVAFSPFL